MKIVKMKISELHHPEKNVRIHTEKQIKEFQKSIRMFGQIRPVVIDENNVILAGNGLVRAMREMGEEIVDVLPMKNLSENDKKKLMIADNRIYTLGYDDNESIFEILATLDGDFDVPGYEEEMLKSLLADTDDVDEHIESYGKLDDEQVEEFERAGERLERQIEKAEQEQAQEDEEVSESKQPIITYDFNEEEVPQQANEEEHRTASIERKVTCPHCGGHIWL